MTKSWGRLAAEELFAYGKTSANIGKEFVETTVSEIGTCMGRKRPFKIPTEIALVELSKGRKGR